MSSDTLFEFRESQGAKRSLMQMMRDPIMMGRMCFPDVFKMDSPDFHYWIANAYLDDHKQKHNIIAPRGHAKSTICGGIIPLHHIMFDQGHKLVLLVSKTQGHAIRLLKDIKFLLDDHPRFNSFFGDWGTHTFQRDTRHEAILKDGSAIVCAGTGQHIRGLKDNFQRPTLIIFDDPEDENNTKTAEAMQHNLDYLEKGIVPAMDKKRGKVMVIGTPLHERCMVMSLKEMSGWHTQHYSAEHNPDQKQPLWPELWSWDELMAEKKDKEDNQRLSVYYQELCCKIIPDETRLFRPDYLQYYEQGQIDRVGSHAFLNVRPTTKNGEPLGKWETVPVNIYTGIDPATSTSSTSDWFVIFHVAIDHKGRRFVLPYVRERLAPSDAIQRIVNEYKKWKPKRVSIETSGQQETFRDILRNMEGIHIPGLSHKHSPRDKKEKRHLELLEPYLRGQKVFIQRNMKPLVDEMMMHPKGKHDDLLDGMYYAFLHARQPHHNKTKLKRDKLQFPEPRIDNNWQLA